MKLLGSTKNKITKNKSRENIFHIEIAEVVLVPYDVVHNDYQQDSRVLYTFVPNKSFCQLLGISRKNLIFLKTCNSDFSYIEIWFKDQSSKPFEIQDKTNTTLVNN